MHSATKFIAGHSDLMAGVLAVKGERLSILLFSCNRYGLHVESFHVTFPPLFLSDSPVSVLSAWRKTCTFYKMPKALVWLRLTVGFVYEELRQWHYELRSNRCNFMHASRALLYPVHFQIPI